MTILMGKKDLYENGQVKFELNYLNDNLDGLQKWLKNGQLELEESYTNGILNGVCRDYHFESGQLHCEVSCINNEPTEIINLLV